MPGSQTTPGPTGARNNAPADFAFRQVNNVGTRIDNDFAAQWLAYTLPYRRFADVLADACARIGGDVDCYSFIAVDFHHILLASLPAHSLALRPAHSRGHQVVTAIRRLQPFRYLHDCSDCFRLERIAGWALHPLESAAFSRRTPIPAVRCGSGQGVRSTRLQHSARKGTRRRCSHPVTFVDWRTCQYLSFSVVRMPGACYIAVPNISGAKRRTAIWARASVPWCRHT